MAKVELKKLFKTYNKKIKALEDINLTIEDGLIFCITGYHLVPEKLQHLDV